MLHTNGTEGHESQVSGFGAEIQAAIKSELDLILAAPAFSQSSRCKKFLNHVVRQALSGHADQLKERILGAKVFDRAYDYNTGEDSIVRVTANEVRKRISQFYQESRVGHRVQIDLPRGSYVPEFRIHPAGRPGEAGPAEAADPPGSEPAKVAFVQDPEVQAALSVHAEPPVSSSSHVVSETRQKPGLRIFVVLVIVLLLVLAAGALLSGIWKRGSQNQYPDIWTAFLGAKAPVLVCLGTHDFAVAKTTPPAETEDVVMREETIPIDDATVLASMARSLASKGIPFRLVAAEQASLTDLQLQPVVLIGAVDNRWTIQITQSLRYRISVEYALGPDKPPIASIFDSEQPDSSRWKIDFSVPISAWRSDYAIVARENDATIGVPVLIEAGLGNSGSLAASEFVTSGALTSALGKESACRGKSDFEAVIGTDIIDTRPGPPHILRLTCW
ncbi:MAG TPA: hypothetical protein VGS10_19325 [Terracidiphilus sp.]|nr:hypothetical protein [Terracidiphilus sp.]